MPAKIEPNRRLLWLEGLLLLLATPILLFPTVAPLLTAVTLSLLAAGWLLYPRVPGRPLPPTPFNGALLLWSLALLVGVLVTADPLVTLPKATGLLLGLAVWRYLALAVTRRQALWLALAAYAALGAGIVVLGLLSADWKAEVPFVGAWLRFLPPQILVLPESAGAIHMNQFAGALLFYLPPALGCALWAILHGRHRRLQRVAAGSATLLLIVLLLLTQSRAGWLGAIAGGVTLLLPEAFLRSRGTRWRAILTGSLAILALVGGLALVLTWPRLQQLVQSPPEMTAVGTLDTLPFRFELWRWALVVLQDFPLTGTGLGTFRLVAPRLYPFPFPNDVAHAHNVFLQVALDTGLPGLVAYLALLAIATFVAYRMAVRSGRWRPLALGLLAALAAFHVYGLSDTLAPGSKPGLAFWMILGLLTGLWRLSQAEGGEE